MTGFLQNDEQATSQRRVFQAVAVSAVLIAVLQYLNPPPPPPAPDTVAEGSAITVGSGATLAEAPADGSGTPGSLVPAPEPPVHLRTSFMDVTITSEGARIQSVALLAPEQYLPRLDMAAVFPRYEDTALPLGLDLGIESLQPDTRYAFDASRSVPSAIAGSWDTATWERTLSNGLRITRTYAVTADAFGLDAGIEITNTSPDRLRLPAVTLLLPGSAESDASGGFFGGSGSTLQTLCHGDFGTKRRNARKASEERRYEGSVHFAGINENYFLSAIAPNEATPSIGCSVRGLDDEHALVSILHGEHTLEPGETLSLGYTVYNGPKDVTFLEAFDEEFEASLDFGWFSFLAVPIRGVLLWIQQYVSNWGLAIIGLTLLLNLVLYPIRRSTFAQSRKMAEVQKVLAPRMEAVKAKYPNDPAKQAEEQMRVYRELNMNPLSGCLTMLVPLLIQMPIFIAMYRAIWSSTELYNAAFYGWITDLSRPDPYFVLPLLIGVLFFIQTKLMPAPSVDNPQFNMMQKIMPPMFTLMMLFMPSGLVLYSLVNTIVSIVQQRIHGAGTTGSVPTL